MKKMYKSLLVAFGTFSRIPLPMVELDEKDGEYSMCFFPMIGVVIGLIEFGLFKLSVFLAVPILLRVCIMAAAPLIITGGIHMDGFVDVSDALNSYQGVEKKLEILKDPHIGAFGVIKLVVYIMLYVGLLSCVNSDIPAIIYSQSFVFSRAFTAITVVLLKNAKSCGMGYKEKSNSKTNAVLLSSILWIGAGFLTALADVKGIVVIIMFVLVMIIYTLFYKKMVYKNFGGFTGDTSGWFLMNSELVMLFIIVIMGIIGGKM